MGQSALENTIQAAIALGVDEKDAQRAYNIACAAGDQPTRFYHNRQHFDFLAHGAKDIFETLKSCEIKSDTAQLLANAYAIAGRDHDMVYVSADKGLPNDIKPLLSSFVAEESGRYTIINDEKMQDLPEPERENLSIALCLFGFKAGQQLEPFGGQNEFLSALASLQVNKGLTTKAKVLIAGLIESTIPFRPKNSVEEMVTRARRLELLDTTQAYALGLAAADMANRDVAGFCGEAAPFQEDTVRLMRENGTDLNNAVSIKMACKGMIDFLKSLINDKQEKPVFRNYQFTDAQGQTIAHPSAEELAYKNDAARRQIDAGIRKLEAMRLAAERWEAFNNGKAELPGPPNGEDFMKLVKMIEERNVGLANPPKR